MARLTIHTAQSAPSRPSRPERRRTGRRLPVEPAGRAGQCAGALEAYQTLSQINARAGLTLQEREVVQLVAGTRHGCTFCVSAIRRWPATRPSSRPRWSRRCAPRARPTRGCRRWPPSPRPSSTRAAVSATPSCSAARGRLHRRQRAGSDRRRGPGHHLQFRQQPGADAAQHATGRLRLEPQAMTATQALTDTGARSWLPAELRDWLDAHAQALDEGAEDPASVLPRLAERRVPAGRARQPGRPGRQRCRRRHRGGVAAGRAFRGGGLVAWGQRVFIEYLLHSPNQALARDWTGPLLRGELAGATALSNAMKFLSGIESLQISARQDGDDWVLDGRMPWVTNLRPDGFLVAAAVTAPDGTAVVALPQGIAGLTRSADLRLLGLQSSNTAALEVKRAHQPALADPRRCPPVPAAGAAGLRRAAMRPVHRPGPARAAPGRDGGQGRARAASWPSRWRSCRPRSSTCRTSSSPACARAAMWPSPGCCSRSASRWPRRRAGGAAGAAGQRRRGLPEAGDGFARRWREAAFLPIVTPSLVQLKTELAKRRAWPGRRGRRHERR